MSKSRKRIGFLSYFGWGRGQAYVTLCYAKMLIPEYDVYILKQGKNPINDEFKLDVSIMEVPEYNVDPKVFKMWIESNKLDAVIFNEYKQWNDDGNNLIKIAKECGAKTYGYLVWEKWAGKDAYKDYDRLIAPTVSFERFYRKNKVRNFTYLPYSIDLNEFPNPETVNTDRIDTRFTFFHPGGWGGVYNRKSTDIVIEAFKALDNKDVKLIISSQKPLNKKELPDNIEIIDKDLSRNELINLYYKSDVILLPSKWETVGLPILESLAAGKPVITSNAPPMNEFINEGLNGYLVSGEMYRYPDIGIYSCEVSHLALKNKMINIMNKMLYGVLSRNARYVAEKIYDLKKNKKYFLELLTKDLK